MAIVVLAKGLGLGVVEEGIEQTAQCAALRMDGCNTGQGFLFSRAVPADETMAFFRDERSAAAG